MFNFQEIWEHLTAPGWITKLRGVGDILQYLIPVSALFFISMSGEPLAMLWLKITFVTALIVHLMKIAFDKTRLGQRPDGNRLSFPSGHTSGAFSGAWFYWFAWGPVAAALPLFLAAVTASSRVLAQKHWIRDVVAGATVACVVAAHYFGVL